MLIIVAYLVRRWLSSMVVISAMLTVILLLLAMAETAGDIAAGQIPPGLFWWQLLSSLPETMNIVVPLAAMSGLILSFGQAALDRELVIMRTSTLPFQRLFAAVAVTTVLLGGLMLLITGYLQPLSQRWQLQLKDEAARSAQLWGMQPGRFVRIPGLDGVAYVAAMDDAGVVMDEVFIVARKDRRDDVLTARQGHYRLGPQGQRLIELSRGQRVEIPDDDLAVRSVNFGAGILEIPQQARHSSSATLAAMTLDQLWSAGSRDARVEWHWRLASPVALVLLSWLGLACALWGQGQGRGWRVMAGIMLYVAYLQMLNLGRARTTQGMWEVGQIYWVHGCFVVLAVIALMMVARRF
ncbi:MAG: LPS export ABC transporter permease LptF [Wenzhouxiangellaceae bacterium]